MVIFADASCCTYHVERISALPMLSSAYRQDSICYPRLPWPRIKKEPTRNTASSFQRGTVAPPYYTLLITPWSSLKSPLDYHLHHGIRHQRRHAMVTAPQATDSLQNYELRVGSHIPHLKLPPCGALAPRGSWPLPSTLPLPPRPPPFPSVPTALLLLGFPGRESAYRATGSLLRSHAT